MNSFKDYLASKRSEDSPIGDLARDSALDESFPWDSSAKVIFFHLWDRRAVSGAIEAFFDAWVEYDGEESARPARSLYWRLDEGGIGDVPYDRSVVDRAQARHDESVVWSGTLGTGEGVASLFVFENRVMALLRGATSSASIGQDRGAEHLAYLLVMCVYERLYELRPDIDEHELGETSLLRLAAEIALSQRVPDALIFSEEDGYSHIICPFCRSEHLHSLGEGTRTPHCSGINNPWWLEYRLVHRNPGEIWRART